MKFNDLKDFISNRMILQDDHNYQPIVIVTLVQNGGSATLEEFKTQLQKANPEHDLNFFTNCPAFPIITNEVSRNGIRQYDGATIANRNQDKFEMLDFDSYTTEQKAWIIVECILKIKEKKEELEDCVEYVKYMQQMMPELESNRKEVLKKYGQIFSSRNIDKLTKKSFVDFLQYKNNKHWTGIARNTKLQTKDFVATKKALKILVDEKIPIEERIKQITSVKGFGVSTFTPILHVASNMKYAVVNGVVRGALDNLGFLPDTPTGRLERYEEWESIVLPQEIVMEIAKRYSFNLWEVDWLWFDVVNKRKPNDPPKYWLITAGRDHSEQTKWLSQKYCAVGYNDLFLPRYIERGGQVFTPTRKIFRSEIEKQMTEREKRKAKEENRKPDKITKQGISWHGIYLAWFMEVAKNDVIVLWDGGTKTFAKGIVTGNYQYKKYKGMEHSKSVLWHSFEQDIPKEYQIGGHPGIFNLKDPYYYPKETSKLYKWLFDDQTSQETMYFLLRHQVDGPWKDDLGKKYHVGRKKNGQMGNLVRKILDAGVGTKTVWYSTSKGDFYFWGYGTVSKIETVTEDKDWNLIYDDFKFFEGDVDIQGRRLKKATESINQQLHNLEDQSKKTGFNWQQSINTIPKKIYEEITGTSSTLASISGKYQEYLDILDWKNNLILYGPPGTGKTYHAVEIAKVFPKSKPAWKVTFHQSYSYEEFMEGLKARLKLEDENDPTSKKYVDYYVEDGIFKKFCEEARKDDEHNYVMIIDEINRGNISKVFGELITVIEKDKRGTDVLLPYSKQKFNVPPNVYIIGTMNTADRSIALIDTALTRRFARKEIMPDSSVLKDKNDKVSVVDGINLKELLDILNQKIYNIGMRERQIGHSYLMKGENGIDNISELRLAFVYDILPLLRELPIGEDEDLQSIISPSLFIDWDTKNTKRELTKRLIEKGHNHADDAFKKEINDFMKWAQSDQELDNEEEQNTSNENPDI